MGNYSEQSFGARLHRMQNILNFVKKWTLYFPPRKEESVEGLETFLKQVTDVNAAATANQQNYNTAVVTRQELFRKKSGSIEKLLTKVRNSVISNYGKSSIEANQVGAIINQYRAAKIIKAPTAIDAPDAEKEISRSQQSYGSVTQFFANLVTLISQMPGYTASNPSITLKGLQQMLVDVNESNAQVASCLQVIRATQNERLALYAELKERCDRIKAYAISEYGTESQEYRSISGIRI